MEWEDILLKIVAAWGVCGKQDDGFQACLGVLHSLEAAQSGLADGRGGWTVVRWVVRISQRCTALRGVAELPLTGNRNGSGEDEAGGGLASVAGWIRCIGMVVSSAMVLCMGMQLCSF